MRTESEGRIGFLGVFTSPAVERAFRQRHFRDDRWLICVMVPAAMLRVGLLLIADYQHFDTGSTFWLLLASRLLFILVSAWVLLALHRATSAVVADRVFFCWSLLLAGMTVSALTARQPGNTGLLMMSFGVILVGYCVTPLSLSRQAILAMSYSAVVLFVSRRADGMTLAAVGAAHLTSNLFGAVMSWRLNHRRREAFLSELREAQLRASLEEAVAEIRTLRGMLCICAWCKRIRDEAQAWQTVETYVQDRTHAEFTHGICPECHRSQAGEIARWRR